MRRNKLIFLILIPAMLVGQNGQLSDAARKLLDKPRLGSAQLTLSDGSLEDGLIVRVTDQFLALQTNHNPLTCENVALSSVASVHWLPTPGRDGVGGEVAFWAIYSPFFAGGATAGIFRGTSSQLKPLRGNWESDGGKSTLEFDGSFVTGRTMAVRYGLYSVAQNQLNMKFDGTPEAMIPFQFHCRELLLDSPPIRFLLSPRTIPVSAPIVGEWGSPHSILYFKPDGDFEERKEEDRYGTFEQTATGVKIHWEDDLGPGGPEWIAQIEHRKIVVRLRSVVTEYRYVSPGIAIEVP
jgi:hypothetical protein